MAINEKIVIIALRGEADVAALCSDVITSMIEAWPIPS